MPFTPRSLKEHESIRKYGPALSLGTTMVGGVLGCTLVGIWLDRTFETGERFTLGGLVLGLVVSGYEVWKVIVQLQKAEKEEQQDGAP